MDQKVEITTPVLVTIIVQKSFRDEFPHPYVAIQVQLYRGFTGINLLVIKQSDAAIIADLMLGGDGLKPAEMIRRNPIKCCTRSNESNDGFCCNINVNSF